MCVHVLCACVHMCCACMCCVYVCTCAVCMCAQVYCYWWKLIINYYFHGETRDVIMLITNTTHPQTSPSLFPRSITSCHSRNDVLLFLRVVREYYAGRVSSTFCHSTGETTPTVECIISLLHTRLIVRQHCICTLNYHETNSIVDHAMLQSRGSKGGMPYFHLVCMFATAGWLRACTEQPHEYTIICAQ